MFDQLRHQVHPLHRMVIGGRWKASGHPARQGTDQGRCQRWRQGNGQVGADCLAIHFVLVLYPVYDKGSIHASLLPPSACLLSKPRQTKMRAGLRELFQNLSTTLTLLFGDKPPSMMAVFPWMRSALRATMLQKFIV